MPDIKPRWEWRTFGPRFGRAEAFFASQPPAKVHDSEEIYLLDDSGDNMKIRDDLLDIKVLREVNADGLEQWFPEMKVPFPLAPADAARVFDTLKEAPATPASGWTLDAFLALHRAPGSSVQVVNVHKGRVRYTVGGCMVECSAVTANGKPTRTVAVEAEDPSAVIRVIRELGLGDYLNTNYPDGLSALIEGIPPRYAVIDAGTNSIKFHVGERLADGTWRTIVDRAELTRLGDGLAAGGAIGAAPLERTATAIKDMVDEAKRLRVLAIAAVGTAGLRIASNGAEVVAAIRQRAGVTIEVISGEEESRLAYLAAVTGLGRHRGAQVVFDTGGGSSQFTFGHDGTVDERFSVDVGAVRYTERYGLDGAVSPETLREAMAAMAADLSRLDGRPAPQGLVAMGGATTNIAAVKHQMATYDPSVVQGTILDRAEIDRQIELYRSRDAAARGAIVGLQPKRADVILAGACIIRTVMEKLGQGSLTVSDRGLRHGVMAERFDS